MAGNHIEITFQRYAARFSASNSHKHQLNFRLSQFSRSTGKEVTQIALFNYFPYSRLNSRQQKNFSPLKFSFPVIKWLAFLLEMILNGQSTSFLAEPKAKLEEKYETHFKSQRGEKHCHFITGKLNFTGEIIFCVEDSTYCTECSFLLLLATFQVYV